MRLSSLALPNTSFQGTVVDLAVPADEIHEPQEHFKVKCCSLVMLLLSFLCRLKLIYLHQFL